MLHYLIFVEFAVLVFLLTLLLECNDDEADEDIHHKECNDDDIYEVKYCNFHSVVVNWTKVLTGRINTCVHHTVKMATMAQISTVCKAYGLRRNCDSGETWCDHPYGGVYWRRRSYAVRTSRRTWIRVTSNLW
jgi:hypothetical protein